MVEELKTLWKGVWTIDVTRANGSQTILLKAICMWNIHDYPTYGLFMNVKWRVTWHALYVVQTWTHDVPVTWGRTCTLDIDGTLTNTHSYRRNRIAFNDQLEHKFAPTWVSTTEFVRRVEEQEEGLRKRTWA